MTFIREVTFDKATFSLDVLKKAAYRLIDQFSVEFQVCEKFYKCILRLDGKQTEESMDCFVSEFRKEVLDQDLRASIAKETEQIRNLILAHAFSKTGLIRGE